MYCLIVTIYPDTISVIRISAFIDNQALILFCIFFLSYVY